MQKQKQPVNYALSEALETTIHHPFKNGGAEHKSAEQLVEEGYNYFHNYKEVASSAQLLANINRPQPGHEDAYRKWEAVAKRARENAHYNHEYKSDRK